MSTVASMFAGMATSEASGRGTFFKEGVHEITLTSVKFKQGGFKGNSFIAEFTVQSSTNPEHRPGSSAAWVVKWERPSAKAEVKSLMLACLGYHPRAVGTPEQQPDIHNAAAQLAIAACDAEYARQNGLEELVSELSGMPLRVECVMTKTQKGGDFTIHNWAPRKDA